VAVSVVGWLVPRRAAWSGAALLGVVVALWLALAAGGGSAPAAAGGWGSLPVGARLAVSRGLGGVVGGFGVVRVPGVGLVARGGGVRSVFGVGGVEVGGGLRLGLFGVGRGGVVRGVGGVAPVVVGRSRVRYVRGGLVEWYANGPLGLEQGFVLGRRPAGSGVLMLGVGVVGGGARGRVVGGGSGLVVSGRGGLLRYGDLSVVDAVGRRVPVRVVLVGSRVWLRVDDVGVRYPLRVDPLVQQAELTASDGDSDDEFGDSVAVSGDTIVVGAPLHHDDDGAVYVFTRPASGWQNATETAVLSLPSTSAIQAKLGSSVAISGDTIVAGAAWYNDTTGAAVVYTMPPAGWENASEPAAILSASDAAEGDQLGYSVSVSGNEIVAGAPAYTANTGPGKVYEFTMPPSGWQTATQTAELTATDGAVGDNIGQAVAISGATIVAGAPAMPFGATPGKAYVFTEPVSGWRDATQTAELTSSDGAAGEAFGTSVAVAGTTIVSGAPYYLNPSGDYGKLYVFTMPMRPPR